MTHLPLFPPELNCDHQKKSPLSQAEDRALAVQPALTNPSAVINGADELERFGEEQLLDVSEKNEDAPQSASFTTKQENHQRRHNTKRDFNVTSWCSLILQAS